MTNYAQWLYDLARVEEARAYAERAYQEALRADDDVVVNQTLLRLARIYRVEHDYARASAMLDEVELRLRKALPPGHYAFGSLALERAHIAQGQGDTGRALDYIDQAIDIDEQAANRAKAGGQFLPDLLTERAVIEIAAGQLSSAEHDVREAVALLEGQAKPGDFSSSNGRAYFALARVLSAVGRTVEARAAAERAVEQLQKALGQQHPGTLAAEQFSRADGEAPNQ
jgi:tetratricopeptide (TPR) repeat protein